LKEAPMLQPFAPPPAGSAALRGTGVALRTAQTIGIEWLDLVKQQADDWVATVERMAACRDPAEFASLQSSLLHRMGERTMSRSFVIADLAGTFLGRMVPGGTAPGPRRNP
jgi:hypothetical protein